MTTDEYAALGRLLLGELRESDRLGPIPSWIMERLAPAIRSIPPQFARLGDEASLGDWINAAAAIEAKGLNDVAFDLLEEMRRVYVRDGDTPRQRVMSAFIWLRRGRIARVAGRLDDAEGCYDEALRRVPRQVDADDGLWWSDLLPNLWIALGILAVGRGNYPLAERETRKLLDARVPLTWRITGHLQMTIVLRKRGRAHEALPHIWAALDALPADDGRRTDALIILGEVLNELGEHRFALEAHLAALAIATWQRHQAAALCGVLGLLAKPELQTEGALAMFTRSVWARRHLVSRKEPEVVDRLIGFTAECLQRVEGSLANSHYPMGIVDGWSRHEQSVLSRGLAELFASRGRISDALHWLDLVERIAEHHGFHERKFEVDALRARWTTAGSDDTPLTAAHSIPRKPRRGSVWARMADLEALATLERVEGP